MFYHAALLFNSSVYVLWSQLSKDMYDEHEDISFSWVREYHYDVCAYIFDMLHQQAGI